LRERKENHMNSQQRHDLGLLLSEYGSLSNKLRHTKAEEQRMSYLQVAISAVKEGADLRELEQEQLNEREARHGLPITQFEKSTLTREQRDEARAFQAFVHRERRDVEGAPMLNHIGTYTGLGFFVPTGFWKNVFESLKAYDILFDDAFCTQIRTPNGVLMTLPLMDDTTNDASVVTEPGSTTSVD